MIVPIRAYYMSRAEDTLRSISAQFLNTPARWQELRSLNAAYPGVANAGPDTLLPVDSAIALPGDPLPWGKPDPVYLWTLAEKFLYTAWGREPTPEEVVPFWRGLTSGAKHLEMGPSAPPAIGSTAAGIAEPPIPPAMQPPVAPPAEATVAPTAAPSPPPAPTPAAAPEPPAAASPTVLEEPVADEPEPVAVDEAPVVETPVVEVEDSEPAVEDVEPVVEVEPETAVEEDSDPVVEVVEPEPVAEEDSEPAVEDAEPVAEVEPEPPLAEDVEPIAEVEPEPVVELEEPAPVAEVEPGTLLAEDFEPVVEVDEPEPVVEDVESESLLAEEFEPVVEVEEPGPAFAEDVESESLLAEDVDSVVEVEESEPAFADPEPAFEEEFEPVAAAPAVEVEEAPPVPQPPPYETPAPEPPAAPAAPPVHESPVDADHPHPEQWPAAASDEEPPLPEPPGYLPPTTPLEGFEPIPGMPDLGPIEPMAPPLPETEAPALPAFMPSLTGATPSAELPVEQVVASSQRVLAGTAIGDAMMLWQLGRMRRRRGGRRPRTAQDPLELSLEQTARMDSLRLIEAAMRQLRAVTVAQLRPKPRVVCVRTGTYGFEVLLDQPVEAPEGWQAASGGYVLELPRGVTVEALDAAGQGPSLCPALVPVGDTAEGPLLLNIEEIRSLAVSGDNNAAASLLTSVVETLGSSPLAGDIRIITVGVSSPVGPGWERIHATSFDSPQLEHLLSTALSPSHAGAGSVDVLVVGPGNDLLFQRAGQIASTPGSRLVLVGATSSAAARWPWRIQVDDTFRAVVHPIAVNIKATQAMRPELAYLLTEAADGPSPSSRF